MIEASGLKIGGRLRDCSVRVPDGRVVALVGPNGAGKTTFLHVVVGLLTPERGAVRTAGEVAFVAQDKPLYDGFRVAEMLTLGRRLNTRWDDSYARERLAGLGIPLDRKVGRLSGGQQAQVALTIALARRPDLLVLDEPLANLDPLARHEVMRSLMGAVAETGMSVVISSHVVSDLVDTCDWLIVLNEGRVQVSGDIDELLSEHRMMTGPLGLSPNAHVVGGSRTDKEQTVLVRGAPVADPRWRVRAVSLDDLVMAYLRSPEAAALPRLEGVRT
ncbi:MULTISPECIES: ATP-binding cassette domain-containing protein [Nonomuraea]|uniref:ABC-2 type transport system ATP-binding protein n=2 Tax=Nonomuraea TaxID=83681 RepID=A0A7W5YSF8_9ACTN|nr:ABC transporter ATP-binding protein [Nonomuraea dietziae]MBB3728979.1 ABC-2 type transport system ATP-binding protein [Nonomuraea dietziae]